MVTDSKYQGDNHSGHQRSSPYGLSRLAPAVDLTDIAAEISSANDCIAQTTSAKLDVILRQIRHLQAEAQVIVREAKRDADLHRATCSFSRVPGGVYHLYERSNGELLWSMLSLEDWNGKPPQRYLGSYRLEGDQSWTDVKDTEKEAGAGIEAVRKLLAAPTHTDVGEPPPPTQ